ncbi:TonB-dependent siderophore receptor [Novosphingobium sp. 2638]|uniref:TonB-dependent siderophore receptor n=2 Tax=Novosphingobium beihaiensis TaxID=2930389 RepID=A0ABT0BUT6_9SPHN|nr:TonB-dependent siderophore receptor [Novosphingobium beihaiensis]
MDDQALNEITEVLEQTVGITYAPQGALGSDGIGFYSRGFDVENFQVDGVPRQTTIFGFEDTTADMAVYDRIEVVRGATGLLNGVGTPAATVNFVRKKPTRAFQAHLAAQVGSWDRYRVEGDVSGPLSASGNIRGRLVAAYQQSDWFTARSHSEKYVLYGIIEGDLTDSTVFTAGAQYQRFENDASANWGVPLFFSDGTVADLPRRSNSGSKWSEMTDSDLMVFAGLDHDLGGGWNAKLDGDYSRPEYDSTFGSMYATTIDPVTGEGATFYTTRWASDLEQWSASLRLSGPFDLLGRSHELMLGGSYSKGSDDGPGYPGWYGDGSSTNQFPVPDAIALLETGEIAMGDYEPTGGRSGGYSEQLGIYVSTRLNLHDRVKVILGARVTNWTEKSWSQVPGESRVYSLLTRDNGVFTPYGGIVVDLTDNISAYASYADIFNPQSNEDTDGDRLSPVEGANYEAGLKAEFYDGRLNASLAVFKIKQDNFALAVPGALTPSGGQAYEAVSGTESKGVELEVSGELLPDWQVSGGYSYTKVEDRDEEPLTTHVPKESVKVFTSYRFSGPLQDLAIGGNLRWQGRSYVANAGPNGETFMQDDLVIIDLMAQYPVLPRLRVSLNVNNILDKKYFTGHNYIGVYGTPRQAIFTAKYSF